MEAAGSAGTAQSNLLPTALLGVCALGLSFIALLRNRNKLRSEALAGRRKDMNANTNNNNSNNSNAAVAAASASGTAYSPAARAAHRRRSTNEAATSLGSAGNHSEDARQGGSLAGSAASPRTPERTATAATSSASVQKSSYYTTRAQLHVQHHSVHLLRWADEVLGVSFSFSPLLFQLTREERQAPLIVLTLSYLRQPSHRVSLAIEATQEPRMSAERYRAMSLEKIRACAELLATSSTRVGSAQCPQAEYCYVDDRDELLYTLAMFVTHHTLAVTVQYTAPTRVRNILPTAFYELVRSLQFAEPAPTPSYLLVSEPRLGLGFRLPLDFTVHDAPLGALPPSTPMNTRRGAGGGEGSGAGDVYRNKDEAEEDEAMAGPAVSGRKALHGPFRPFARALRRGTQRMGLMACYEPPLPRAVHELSYALSDSPHGGGARGRMRLMTGVRDEEDDGEDDDDDSVHQHVPSNEEEESSNNDDDEEEDNTSWSTGVPHASPGLAFSPLRRRQELLRRYLGLRVRAALAALGLRQGRPRGSAYTSHSPGLPRVVLRETAEESEHGGSDTVADRDLDGVLVLRPFMLRRQAHGNFAREEEEDGGVEEHNNSSDVSGKAASTGQATKASNNNNNTNRSSSSNSAPRTSTPALLRGYFGMTCVQLCSPRSVCWSMLCDEADCLVLAVRATSERTAATNTNANSTTGEASQQQETHTITKSCMDLAKEDEAGGGCPIRAYYAVFFLLLDELCVSFHFVVREARHAFTELVGFCTSTMRTVTLGNHYGQHSSVLYCNLRHDILPFRLTLSTTHALVEEPMLGDPLAVLYDAAGTPVIVRALPLLPLVVSPPVRDAVASSAGVPGEAGLSLSAVTSTTHKGLSGDGHVGRRHHRTHHILAHTMRAYLQDLGEQVRVLQWRVHTLNAQPAVSVLFTTCAMLLPPGPQPQAQQQAQQGPHMLYGGVASTPPSLPLLGVAAGDLPAFGSLVSPQTASLVRRSPAKDAALVSHHVCGDVCSTAALSEMSLAPTIQSQQEVELEEVGTGNPLAQYDARAAQLCDRALLAMQQREQEQGRKKRKEEDVEDGGGGGAASRAAAQGIYLPCKADDERLYGATRGNASNTTGELARKTLPASFFATSSSSLPTRDAIASGLSPSKGTTTAAAAAVAGNTFVSAILSGDMSSTHTTSQGRSSTARYAGRPSGSSSAPRGSYGKSTAATIRNGDADTIRGSQYYFHDRRAAETTLWSETNTAAVAGHMQSAERAMLMNNNNSNNAAAVVEGEGEEEEEDEAGAVRVAVAVCSEGHAFVLLANASVEGAERVLAEVQTFATRLTAMPRTT